MGARVLFIVDDKILLSIRSGSLECIGSLVFNKCRIFLTYLAPSGIQFVKDLFLFSYLHVVYMCLV